ncbi:FMN-binding protein [Acetobacterium malicum]|uniref:FMN-binding protein n=1 Tax=Acetobacterium malicum TaxID=52692 RepID=UPI0035939A5C
MLKNKFNYHTGLRLIIFFLIAALIPLLLTGCAEKELINDPATGSILPTENSESLMDGQYSASTKYYDTRGYAQQLNILIKNGIITRVNLKEIDKNKADRLTVEGSDKTWTNLAVANLGTLYLRLYNELLLSQNPDEIDAISGATQTSERFVDLSAAILDLAEKGDHEPIKIDTFDTYSITSAADHDGYQGFLQASFNGTTLVSLNYDEIITEDGKSKRKSTDSSTSTEFNALFDTITKTAVTTQSLESPFPANEPAPEKVKYGECLRLLREARAPF